MAKVIVMNWVMARATSGARAIPFPQRFTGRFEDDGKTIVGRWEKGVDSVLRGRL
jgi:hypothetical protein